MNKKPLYICDIDGTIADMTHRLHLIQGDTPDWPAFYEACDGDTPIDAVRDTLYALESGGCEIWFFTGRMDMGTVREKTVNWIVDHFEYPHEYVDKRLVMRPDADYRADDIIKLEMLQNMLECDRERLVGVFDDRQRVVDMWRANGVFCMQVAPGDF